MYLANSRPHQLQKDVLLNARVHNRVFFSVVISMHVISMSTTSLVQPRQLGWVKIGLNWLTSALAGTSIYYKHHETTPLLLLGASFLAL